jgi:hypothetical protein
LFKIHVNEPLVYPGQLVPCALYEIVKALNVTSTDPVYNVESAFASICALDGVIAEISI